ncbi:protein cab-1-like [Lytechinus pictus]|uniref:protein cab-1-like n=1 Tax=Lytechinus pictus TaxID=7653 RepID=UPI0030B9DC27
MVCFFQEPKAPPAIISRFHLGSNDTKVDTSTDGIEVDTGTDGIEVDTGNGQPPPPPPPPADGQSPPGANQETEADVGAEGNQADTAGQGGVGGSPDDNEETFPSDDFQESNADVQAHQAQNNGSVILLAEWQFILIVVGCVAVAIIGVAIAFICWYKIQTTSKAQNEADYPAYGVTGPGAQVTPSMNNGDRKLAQSAQMYHYQHQKQQMIAMEKREKGDVARDASDYDSEEENEDGDLTVYECPGLAPTGEMQVKNPLFAEDAYPKQGGDADGEEKQ